MPGFNINGTGGKVSSLMETRRKHRWEFTALANAGIFSTQHLLILQSAQRPNFKFEEPEMHHDQEVVYFAGKQSWEPITLTWYDAEQPIDVSAAMWNWINSVVNMDSIHVNVPSAYKTQGTLVMVSGGGSENGEVWTLYNCWPKESNWGELDYTSTDIATIEVQMRYDRATRA